MPTQTNLPTTINLGDEVRDTISGFVGIAIARTTWLHGCARIGVDAREPRDGKPIETQWFDEARLVVSQPAVVPPPPPEVLARHIGGVRADAPTRRSGEG